MANKITTNLARVTAVVLTVSQAVMIVFIIFVLHRNSSSIEKQPDRTHILILSSWRSGSSLTGQFFSQHPNVFYLMEPAWHVWTTMNQNSAKVLQMSVRDLIRSVFLCDMSVFDAYLPKSKTKSNLFQWETSRALCSPPACNSFERNDIMTQLQCKTLCSKYPFYLVEQACKTYSHIALKEVRFFDLKVLFPLLNDPSLNLKILHLVRDLRAVFHSHEKLKTGLTNDDNIVVGPENNKYGEGIYKVMNEICKSHIDIYNTATQNSSIHLNNRYLLVRYEDIVQNPLERAEQMYTFAGLQNTPNLRRWVYDITHGNGTGQSFVITSRNALVVSKAWREKVPFEKIQRVQDLCKNAMELLGYQLVSSEMQQKSMSSDLLLAPQHTHSKSQPNC